MSKTPVQVVIRTRPTANFAYKNIQIDENTGYVGISRPKDSEQGYVNHQQENWGFNFNKVLCNASQEVVYDVCAKDVVRSVLEGYSGTILCYGQTGAGKTFTMTGSTTDYKYRGIIPHAIQQLYQEIQGRYEQQITVGISYLEIYNETLTDLLAESLLPESNQALSIQEDIHGRVHVKGQLVKICQTEEEAQAMVFEGETNRTITEHKLNKTSTRSHCVFTIHLEIRSRVESSEKVIISKLHLVDLAGSERTKKTGSFTQIYNQILGSEGQTLLEAQFINKSLSFLEQVVVALSEKQRDHIPYRQSKLTNLLKDSIGGSSKTIMIANIWPEASHLEETISTLKFATRMMKVTNDVVMQLKLDPSVLLKKYEKEIKDLKQELAMHDTLANRGRITYDAYSSQQQQMQQQIAKDFLENKIEDIEFESIRQVKELFFQFRNLYKNLLQDVENRNYVEQAQGQEATIKKQSEQGKQTVPVGQESNQHGFGIGKARKDAKPTQNIENLVNIPREEFKDNDKLDQQINEEKEQQKLDSYREKRIVNVDRNQAYAEFKQGEGKEINDAILNAIHNLKDRKDEIRELNDLCTKAKNEIEEAKFKLDKKKENKNQEEISHGIIDEEEYEIIKELKIVKKQYKQHTTRMKELKSDITIIDQNIIQSKSNMIVKFEEWFQKKYGISINDVDNPLINQPSEPGDVQKFDQQSDSIDTDALAYIRAKKKVGALQKARKQERLRHG